MLEGLESEERVRSKRLKFVNDHTNLMMNYLENFRTCEYMFNDRNSVALEFVIFLLEIPV